MALMSTMPPPAPAPRPSAAPTTQTEDGLTEGQKRGIIIGVTIGAVVLLVGAIAAAYYLVNNPAQAASVRDVFIIFMAFEFIVIGVALVVLVVQLAVLTNMLRHEIKPILESTNETVNTVRGTTLFLSDNLVEPIMKLNSYVAALARLVESLGAWGGFGRKK
jgi:predicted tellurium resistance membrane protein TerC